MNNCSANGYKALTVVAGLLSAFTCYTAISSLQAGKDSDPSMTKLNRVLYMIAFFMCAAATLTGLCVMGRAMYLIRYGTFKSAPPAVAAIDLTIVDDKKTPFLNAQH